MGTVAFAATDNAAEADVLYDLGLFKGRSATEKVLDLEGAANAADAIVLIGRALGWATDAEATVAFTDVPDYAVPFVAYAVEMKITNGISATEFGTAVTGERMVTWVLRSLGYDFDLAYTDVTGQAATAGLAIPTGDVSRDTVAGVIYDTLTTTPVGGTTTVIEDLIAADATLEAAAIAAELVAAPSEDFAIVSAESFGLAAIKVTFASDIDGDVTIDSEDADGDVDDVVEDGSVAIIVLEDVQDQNAEITIELTATGKDEIELTEEEIVVVMADKDDPELVSVTVENAKTIVVEYSEPIDPASFEGPGVAVFDDVLVGEDKVVGELEQSDDLTTLTYNLSDALEANTYEFTMEAVADFAGFVAAEEVTTITVVADDAAPQIVSVEVIDLDTIELTFDEDVYAIDNVEVAGDDATVETDLTNGEDVIELTLAADLEPSDAFIAVTVTWEDAEDVVGNKADGETTFMAPLDDAAPVASITINSDNEIEVQFDEAVTGLTVGDFSIVDADDDDADVDTDTLTEDADTDNLYILTLDDPDIDATTLELTLEEDAAVDGSVLANKNAETVVTLEANDLMVPTVSDAKIIGDDDEIIRVAFSEAMDVATLEDVSNYILNNEPLKNWTVDITVADDAKSVDIEVLDDDEDPVNVSAAWDLDLYGAEDAAGNSLAGAGIDLVDATGTFADVSFELTAVDTIVVTSASNSFVIADPDDFELYYDNGVTVTTIYVKKAVADDNEVTLTLSKDLKADVTTDNALNIEVAVVSGDTVNTFDDALVIAATAVTDGVSATADITDEQSDEIVVVFDEALDLADGALSATTASDIIVRDEDGDVVSGLTVTAATADGVTTLTIDGGDLTVAEDTDFTVEIFSRYLTDVAGNVINALEETDVIVKD